MWNTLTPAREIVQRTQDSASSDDLTCVARDGAFDVDEVSNGVNLAYRTEGRGRDRAVGIK